MPLAHHAICRSHSPISRAIPIRRCTAQRHSKSLACAFRAISDFTALNTDHTPRRHPDLLKGLFAMGFDKPSKIQEKALPLLLTDPCVLAFPPLSFTRSSPRSMQAYEHDRAIAVWHRKDGSVRAHDAEPQSTTTSTSPRQSVLRHPASSRARS